MPTLRYVSPRLAGGRICTKVGGRGGSSPSDCRRQEYASAILGCPGSVLGCSASCNLRRALSASPSAAGRGVQNSALMWRCVLFICLLPFAAVAQTDDDTKIRSTSKPRFQVVDGNTVRFGSKVVRLFAIDVAAKGQTCDDGHWQPAPLARKALEGFIAGRPVTCKQADLDAPANPPVAQCFAGNDDLQAMMVSAGWAWAAGRYRDRYAPEEREAMARKAGMHGHRCVPPSEWRAQHRDRVGQ